MLVLSRKKNEGIRIGATVELVVVEIRGDKVRLGIQAPPDVPVHRDEVYAAIRRNQAAAGQLDAPMEVGKPQPSHDEEWRRWHEERQESAVAKGDVATDPRSIVPPGGESTFTN